MIGRTQELSLLRRFGIAVVVALVLLPSAGPASAQLVQHKPEPWIVSVNHRIDLNAHAQQLGGLNNGQEVRVLRQGRGRTINLASGVLIDEDGHVVTRLVNLDPRVAEHDIQITTASGSILPARFVGFDGPTGLALLFVPGLRGVKPAPGTPIAPLADGATLRLVSADYKLSQISVPVERVALFPALVENPARASTSSLTPALERAGVHAIVESAALTSSKDLSSVETPDGKLVGIARFAAVGRAHVLTVSFLRDVVARRVLSANGSVAAGWLGADGSSLSGTPDDQKPSWAPDAGVLVRNVSPKGPADIAGLQRSDCIVAFDRVPVRSSADLATSVLATPAGTSVSVELIRDGKPMILAAVLGGQPFAPGNPAVVLPSPVRAAELRLSMLRSQLSRTKSPESRATLEAEIRDVEAELALLRGETESGDAQFDALFDDTILVDLGLEGVPLSEQLARHFGVNGGILISNVKAGSIGDQAGLKAGDIIVMAGDAVVMAEDELAEFILNAARGGKTVVELSVRRSEAVLKLPVPVGKFRRP